MRNKLCSCLGYALRLAQKNPADHKVYLQAALFALTQNECKSRPCPVQKKIICLADCLGTERRSENVHGICREENLRKVSELSSKLARMRLEFQEDRRALQHQLTNEQDLSNAKMDALRSERAQLQHQCAALTEAVQGAGARIQNQVFEQLTGKLQPLLTTLRADAFKDNPDHTCCLPTTSPELIHPMNSTTASTAFLTAHEVHLVRTVSTFHRHRICFAALRQQEVVEESDRSVQ